MAFLEEKQAGSKGKLLWLGSVIPATKTWATR